LSEFDLSIVVPIYNEEASVEPLHQELARVLETLDLSSEIILVDDGSRDRSLEMMRAVAVRDPRVRVVALEQNAGQTAALDAGFRAVRGTVTITLDADLQNDPADIPTLLMELKNADVVNGVRTERRDTWLRRFSSKLANRFRNWATHEAVTDVGCSLRAIRSEYLKRVKLYRGMHRFLPTLLRLEGARIVEVPVHHHPRRHGTSKYGIGNRLFAGLVDILAVRWMQRRALRYRIKE